jgi:PAS domain S-box-containing protein
LQSLVYDFYSSTFKGISPMVMHSNHNLFLVLLSIAVAILASYTALSLAARIRAAQGTVRLAWLTGGMLAMGLGIWAMHFVGMLAHIVGIRIEYNLGLVVASVVVAMLASGLALFIATLEVLGLPLFALSGAIMGAGIAAMHYTGMAAIEMRGEIQYNPILVAASVAIAVGASLAALWLIRLVNGDPTPARQRLKRFSALVMGIAIVGMHYTGMAAATFISENDMTQVSGGVPASALAGVVTVGTVLSLALALLSSAMDERLAMQTRKAQLVFEQNALLERRVSERTRELDLALQRVELLAALSDALQSAKDPAAVGQVAMARLGPTLRASWMAVYKIESERLLSLASWVVPKALNLVTNQTEVTGIISPVSLSINTQRADPLLTTGLIEQVATNGHPFYALESPGMGNDAPFSVGLEPIRNREGQVVALFTATRNQSLGVWLEGERYLMVRAATTIGLALERAETGAQLQVQGLEIENRKQFLDALVANVSEGILACDANGELTLVNDTTREFYGLPSEPLTLEAWMNYSATFKPDGSTVLGQAEIPLVRALMGEEVRDLELRVVPKHGEARVVLVNGDPIIAPSGEKLGAVVAMRDITARKQAELALWESEERFRQAFQASAVGVALIDLKAQWLRVNPALCAMLGYSPELLQGQDIGHFTHEADFELVRSQLQVLLEGNVGVLEWQARLMHRLGHVVWVQCNASVVRDRNNQAVSLIAQIQDITERRRTEQELQHFTAALERSNRELQDFAHVASHDLQEPLRKILTFGDRLKNRVAQVSGLDEQSLDYLNRMQNSAARMQNLITDLLSFSRVESKPRTFSKVDLNHIAHEVLGDLETRIEQSAGQVLLEALPQLEADPLLMRQLLQNLIGNALKFHRQGVAPVVKVFARQAESNPKVWELIVQDNGIGFDQKYLDKIFVPFQRLHGRDNFEGTGIGLAICRKIAERHGGNITAHSSPNQGATFVVTLPARHNPNTPNSEFNPKPAQLEPEITEVIV